MSKALNWSTVKSEITKFFRKILEFHTYLKVRDTYQAEHFLAATSERV